ncbi:MAG: LLM class flavin-dependent oxidoreductase [Pseudonocardia sp.]|nr:LLM class flavin-dependent oxidoreductase [Pseudonocardia sp.]
MKVGVFLPSFLLPDRGPTEPERLRGFARRAEELGFDSLWITDHVVTARRFYRVSWLDSLMTLSHVAAVTKRVKLGTSILILPLRQPAVLAKEIATLHHLSGERYIYGVGVGWYGPEFEACGVRKSERGVRTDEVLRATHALLTQDEVEFHGRYYDLTKVTVEPRPLTAPPTWVGGGRQLEHEASPEQSRMSPTVLERIVNADGWIARPTCPPHLIVVDLQEIIQTRTQRQLTRPFTVAHENFTWLTEACSADAITAEQQLRFSQVVSNERPWNYIDAVYLTGSIDDIQKKIQARIDAGIEYLMLHTLTTDPWQLELMAKHVLEPFHNSGSRQG